MEPINTPEILDLDLKRALEFWFDCPVKIQKILDEIEFESRRSSMGGNVGVHSLTTTKN